MKRSSIYAAVFLSSVAVRKEPDHSSEMVTNLLFGEAVKILYIQREWSCIVCGHDSYPGWVHSKQLMDISQVQYDRILCSQYFSDNAVLIDMNTREEIHLVRGSRLLLTCATHEVELGLKKFLLKGHPIEVKHHDREHLLSLAKMYLNTPYLWGARSTYGIDCSGLMQVLFGFIGVPLLRDASQQAESGTVITLDSVLPCDLLFFRNDKNKISHVGLVYEPGKIIHSSGYVRIDTFDRKGIWDGERYSHKFAKAIRVIP